MNRKKLNNRGFAITTILFGFVILFLFLFLSLLGMLSLYKNNLEKLVGTNQLGARKTVSMPANKNFATINDLRYSDEPKSGLYCFNDGCRYVSNNELSAR